VCPSLMIPISLSIVTTHIRKKSTRVVTLTGEKGSSWDGCSGAERPWRHFLTVFFMLAPDNFLHSTPNDPLVSTSRLCFFLGSKRMGSLYEWRENYGATYKENDCQNLWRVRIPFIWPLYIFYCFLMSGPQVIGG